jgi:hypothetical protein
MGNRELLRRGAVVLKEADLGSLQNLADWFRQNARSPAVEPELFGAA